MSEEEGQQGSDEWPSMSSGAAASVGGDQEEGLQVSDRLVAVATDGSESATRAVSWAAAHATDANAEFVAIQVLDGPAVEDLDGHLETIRATLETDVKKLVASGRAIVIRDDGRGIAEMIVMQAERIGAEELVVGNSGMRGRTEFLLGNIANRVTHLARCTVVVVNTGLGAAEPGAGEPHPRSPGAAELGGRAAEIARILGPVFLRALSARVFSPEPDPAGPRRLRCAFEELGPAFGKIGQILSTRPDLIPEPYLQELTSLQADVPPMTEAEVVSVMEHELGVPWEDAFSWIDPSPLAAGTIGQVHRARLVGGDRVVVKVQRPTAATLVEQDLALLEGLVRTVQHVDAVRRVVDLTSVVDRVGEALRAELDYHEEATNLERMKASVGRYSRLEVPACHRDLSSARLLVMDEVDGIPALSAPPCPERTEAAQQLLHAYYQQVIEDGFFHADPHPGNLLWADGRIWLLDLGMVGEIDARTRRQLMLMFLALAQQDAHLLAEVALDMVDSDTSRLDFDAFETEFAALMETLEGQTIKDVQIGELFNRVIEIAVRHRVPLPSSLTMVGKALAQAQRTVAELAPDLDPIAEARSFFGASLLRRFVERLDPQDLVYEAEKWRYRLDRIGSGVAALNRVGVGGELHFTSARLERSLTRAGRTVAVGLFAGLVWIAAGVAANSSNPDERLARGLRLVAGGLSAGFVGAIARRSK